jgi:Heavy metal binding domain
MIRISILLAAAFFCVLHAPVPDPRVLAEINAAYLDSGPPLSSYPNGEFYCPMDGDIRSDGPGFCPKCGMKLVEGVKDVDEYPLNLTVEPSAPRASEITRLTFGVVEPKTQRPARNFETVHERLYHVFVVSQDLTFFLHTHPERNADEDFHLDLRFPKAGMYRVLSDFYPSGGTPQLITNTVMIPGDGFALGPAHIGGDLSPRQSENSRVELEISPPRVIAREKVSMLFRVSPGEELEPYLGAWGHMLAASSDLIDMMHHHAFQAADGRAKTFKEIAFNVNFPRAGVYRVWVQFQRKGVVNTVAFDIPVVPSS